MKLTIEVDMKDRWVPVFLSMLRKMEYLGNIGASRKISFYSDGDGDFRPKFSWDENLPVNDIDWDIDNDILIDAG